MNYYIILGINNNATQDEVKSAYRQRAMQLHPDHYGSDAEPFRRVQEAYSVLGDPERRRAYDKALNEDKPEYPSVTMQNRTEPLFRDKGRSKVREQSTSGFSGKYSDPFDNLFDRLFDRSFFFSENQRHENVVSELELVLTSDEARQGGRVDIEVPVNVTCPDCHGFMLSSFFGCPRCAGKGRISIGYPLQIEIPAGIKDGTRQKITLQSPPASGLYVLLYFRIETA